LVIIQILVITTKKMGNLFRSCFRLKNSRSINTEVDYLSFDSNLHNQRLSRLEREIKVLDSRVRYYENDINKKMNKVNKMGGIFSRRSKDSLLEPLIMETDEEILKLSERVRKLEIKVLGEEDNDG